MIATFIICIHFLFDWILQPREIAMLKKHDFFSMIKHLVYQIIPMLIIMVYLLQLQFGIFPDVASILMFVVLNFIIHAVVDIFLPSGIQHNGELVKDEKYMITMTAIDQMIHISTYFLILDLIHHISQI